MNFQLEKRIGLFLFFLPSILYVVLSVFLFQNLILIIKEVLAFFLFNLICTTVVFQFSKKAVIDLLNTVFVVLMTILSFLKLGFVILYDSPFSASALFVIFETNKNEAVEYLSSYFDVKLFLLLGLHFVFAVFTTIILRIFAKEIIDSFHVNFKTRILFFSLTLASVFILKKKFYKQDLFLAAYYGYSDYIAYKAGLKNQLSKPKPSKSFNVSLPGNKPQTHVVIIGESLTRNHMSLYGYPRVTNPLLHEKKLSLYVFNEVISPHTHTMPSLEKVLTLSSFDSPKPVQNMSIVQLANAAGFNTHWISNQRPLGMDETLPTIIASASKYKYWKESSAYSAVIYDEKLLPTLKKVLTKPEDKKVIFLHLIGTHGAYDRRYPKEFDYFKDTPPIAISKESKVTINVNHYDNAVRYNDFIVNEIIKELKEKNLVSSVTYFSDHGEEVYESVDFMGHHEYFSTKAMYEVPLLFWFSDKFKEQTSLDLDFIKGQTDKKYILEDFPHTFADLIGVDFEGFDANKSVLNKSFKEKKRIIRNNRDYDKW